MMRSALTLEELAATAVAIVTAALHNDETAAADIIGDVPLASVPSLILCISILAGSFLTAGQGNDAEEYLQRYAAHLAEAADDA